MRNFFGGNEPQPEKKQSTTSSMFSYFSNGPDLPHSSQQPNKTQQPPQQQQPQSQQQQQGQQRPQQQQTPILNGPPSNSSNPINNADPTTTPLKIKLSSPTLAIGTPILCHGYNNQEGVFCWYRISPSNPFYLITTTLQPSYTPTIDDANNTIICQFKPDAGVPSEYARLGPIRLPPETAHSVIRLMQNKQFINTPLTYVNSKGFQNISLMKKWLSIMTTIQELEVQKTEQIKKNQLFSPISNQLNTIDISATTETGTNSQAVALRDRLDLDPELDPIEFVNKNKYDSQLDYKLALAHQELHSLIIADSFNPLVRAAPVQNVMENHNLRHLQDYTLTINSETLELVFTPPTFDQSADDTQLGASDEDSEDEEHATVSKNRSSMGDLLSFLSAGVGNDDPNARPIQTTRLNNIGESSDSDTDDDDEEEEDKQQEENVKKQNKVATAPPTIPSKPTTDLSLDTTITSKTFPESLASPKKTLSKQNEALMWNSIKMPSIPLSNAVFFTTRHDIVVPIEHNIPPTTSIGTDVTTNPETSPTSTQIPSSNAKSTTTTTTKDGETTVTYPAHKLLVIMDIRTAFIYTFYFESDVTRDHYGLALRAMSEKLHSKRTIPTFPGGTSMNNGGSITPSPLPSANVGASTSTALTTVIPPAPIFKSWLPIDLQRKYRIEAPFGLGNKLQSPTSPLPNIEPTSPILSQLSSTLSGQSNYFNDLEPIELFETIARSEWFQELHPGYIPPLPTTPNKPSSSSSTATTGLLREGSQHSNDGLPSTSTPATSTHSSLAPASSDNQSQRQHQQQYTLPPALNNQDNVLPDVALLFKVYQHDQDSLVSLLQEKIQYLYQRNLTHKRQSQLLTKQQHMVSLELEIYKEKYYNERSYNDELVHSYYDNMSNTSHHDAQPILSRQLFQKQQHQLMVKTQSILADTRGHDISGASLSSQTPVTPIKPGNDNKSSSLTNHHKDSILSKDLLQSSMSTPQLTRVELTNDIDKLQDQVMHYQQAAQQLKRDNKQLIASNLAYKEQASMASEFEEEIVSLRQKLKTNTQTTSKQSSSSNHDSSSTPAITTLQTTIVELSQQTQQQQQDISLKDRKLSNYETQISKLTQQLHLAYQQQQDLISKGIKVEQEKLRQQYNSTEQELNDTTNVMKLVQNENNLYKTQASLMESLNIQQHVEIETLETTIDTLQTSLVGLINENEYLKKQQQAFITLQQQFKQQQAQLLLLQHENVTLSNTIQEHQQHIVNLQQQKQMLTRNQSLVGTNMMNGNQGGASGGVGSLSMQSNDHEKVSNLHSELQYYKQKCYSLSTSLERLMRKHHQEMMNSNSNSKLGNSVGKKGGPNLPSRTIAGANNALIDPLNDTTDQELLQKIYTQQAHTMTHEQLCKEYKNLIKQLELLLETNKLLRFDMKQSKLQHDAVQQQLNDRVKYGNQNTGTTSSVTMQSLQRDLLEKQLQETKHLVTTLTFVLQDKQQHIELIKSTNKQLVIELDFIKKQLHNVHLQQQENQHLAALQQVANGQNINGENGASTMVGLNLGNQQPFYF